jgi:hypothetical protein
MNKKQGKENYLISTTNSNISLSQNSTNSGILG